MSRVRSLFSESMKSELLSLGYCDDVFGFSDSMGSHQFNPSLSAGRPRPKANELKIQLGKLSKHEASRLLICLGSDVPESIVMDIFKRLCVTSRSPLTWREEKFSKSLFEEFLLRGFDLSTFQLSINMTPHDRKRIFRRPRTNAGELKMQWGKIGQDCADLLIAWGDGCQQHSRLFYHFFEDSFYNGQTGRFESSLSDAFREAGLNVKSLKVYCSLKKTTHC